MNLITILFWIVVVIVAWLGLRNLITIFVGSSLSGPLKPGQPLCHFTELLLYWGACLFAIITHSWWPLFISVIVGYLLRKLIIWSGKK